MKHRLIALVISSLLCVIACAYAQEQAVVQVDTRAPAGRISDYVYGNNVKAWGGGGELLRDSKDGQLNADAVARIKPLRPTILRFPGGGKAEQYDWRAAVGPKRGDAGPQFAFGTDEFLGLCRELDAEPMITVNWSAGPAAAAAWVEYCNGSIDTPNGRLRAANGHPQPYHVRYWEIGNELFSKVPVKTYAASVPQFVQAMKTVDPTIQIGAVGWGWPNWHSHYTKDADPWNETVLAQAGKVIDALIIHQYCWVAPQPPAAGRNADLVRTVLAWPRQMAQQLSAVRKSAAAAGRPDLPFWITEYNGYYGEKGMSPLLCETLNGVLNASMLQEFIRAGVPVANYWELATAGWDHFAAIAHPRPKLWQLRPASYILGLYSHYCRGELLPVTVQSPTFTSLGYGIIKPARDTPTIDAIATRDGNQITVALINKDLATKLSVTVELKGATSIGTVTQRTFAGSGPFSTDYTLHTTTIQTTAPWHIDLPPCSVTLVTEGKN